LGLLAGFIGSVGFIFVRERTDRTLRQPGDVKLWASLSELGTIPSLQCNPNRSPWALGTKRETQFRFNKSNESAMLNERSDLLNVARVWDKPTATVEAFHSALTSILLAGDKRETGQVLVFTSVGPSDGKTSVVSNLSIAAARTGKKVLLVDADLRRPRIHDVFGLRRIGGIADILRSESIFSSWRALIQQSRIANLSVITAGTRRRATTNLFYSHNFSSLLRIWGEEYDLVLIDTPPAMHITDARVIGALSDGVVLVARAGQTTRDELISIQERFTEDRIHLLGCILNDWDPSRSGPNYSYPYYLSEEQTIA